MRRPERWELVLPWVRTEVATATGLGLEVPMQVWCYRDDWLLGDVPVPDWGRDPVASCLALGDGLRRLAPDAVVVVRGLTTSALAAVRVHRWRRTAGWTHGLATDPDAPMGWPGLWRLPDWDPWVRTLSGFVVPVPPQASGLGVVGRDVVMRPLVGASAHLLREGVEAVGPP